MTTRTGIIVAVLFLATILPVANAATETQVSQMVIDPEPFRTRTVVASSGNGYLVVWGAVGSLSRDNVFLNPPMTIYIRAVSADGIPLRESATAVGKGEFPSIAWNGREYLVVWGITSPTTGTLPTPSLVGIRVREDGALIDPVPVTLIAEVNPFSYVASVTWSGSQYLVTWTRGAALVDTDLHVKPVFLQGGIPFYSASSGGDFLVLAAVYSSDFANKQSLLIEPVSSTGNPSTPIPFEGPYTNIANVDGGYLLLSGNVGTPLRTTRLRADGTTISTSPFYVQPQHFPSMAARGGRILAAWLTDKSSVCITRIDIASQPACSNPQLRQGGPVIGMASNSVLFAWRDTASDGDVLRVATSSGDAPQVDNNAGRIISDHLPAPSVVRRVDGTVTAAWTEYNPAKKQSEVRIGGISSKGLKLADRVVFATPLDQGSPVVSAGAGRTAILWTEGTEPKIRMSIVDDLSGALIATLSLPAGITPSAAFNGTEWLVTWQSTTDGVVRFAIVNSDGFVLRSGAAPVTTASPSQSAPAAAWSGKTYFLAWLDANRVQISTINAAGAPSAPVTLDSRDIFPGSLSIAGNGNRMLVAWGRTGNILRQAVFDADGNQLGKFIDFAWPDMLTRTRTHAMPIGFATLAGAHVALTSADGVGLDTLEVPAAVGAGDFVVDPANRFTFIYPRLIGRGSSANFAQTIGLPRRHPQNR
jgi:hypothetical protein